ncbi:MAG: extracellular solute-binding protein [Firmicutes bacterium]|jgi:raffinose/stachyose/melibiose transport system substrate-binding protein|nr:extracellular solute-binding protein [Bacillota bacterium]
MSKRLLSVVAAALLLVTLSFAAGAEKKVVVKFFTGKVETVEWMNSLIKQFNKENPGIEVQQEYQRDASNVIKVKFASGDIPDITTVWDQGFADMGRYLDLSGETQWWSRVQPAVKELCTDLKSGKQYRIATNMTMAGLFYNTKIFSDLGLKEATTWEEFKSNLKTIKQKRPDVVPMFMGGKDSWMLGHLIEFMAHGVIKQQYGTMGSRKAFLNNEEAKLRFDAPDGPMETFAKRLLELKEEGLLNSDFLTATYDNQLEAFATGKAAVISQGMWALSGILERNKNMKDIGFCPYPPIVDGTKPVVLAAEDSAYLITAESKCKEEAKKFLDYLFRPENLKAYSEFLKAPCAFTDVSADWGPLKDEVAKALRSGVNIGFTTEAPSGFSGDDAGRMVQELYVGKYRTPADFAKAYKAAWDKAWKAANK